MSDRAIVLDANILIRAVLGKRVRELLVDNAERVQFFSPDVAYADARKYLPALLKKRGVNSASAMAVLNALESIVLPLELGVYVGFKTQALERIALRDADDWPVLACAMAIGCPVWTEDADFFGAGVATWTSDRVALYLAG
jgi:predicted nucleic acid-binding protein